MFKYPLFHFKYEEKEAKNSTGSEKIVSTPNFRLGVILNLLRPISGPSFLHFEDQNNLSKWFLRFLPFLKFGGICENALSSERVLSKH